MHIAREAVARPSETDLRLSKESGERQELVHKSLANNFDTPTTIRELQLLVR